MRGNWKRNLISAPRAFLGVFIFLLAAGTARSDHEPVRFSLVSFHGKVKNNEARAVCLKARGGAVPKEQPNAFCFYDPAGAGVLLRSDDEGVGKAKARPVAPPEEQALVKWLHKLDPSYTIDQPTVQTILARLKSGQTKAADLNGLFQATKLHWASSLDPVDQEIGPVADAAAFERTIESRLMAVGPAPQPAQVPKPAPAPEKPGGPRTQQAGSELKELLQPLQNKVSGLTSSSKDIIALLHKVITLLVVVIALGLLALLLVVLRSKAESGAVANQTQVGTEHAKTETDLDQILEKYKPETSEISSQPLKSLSQGGQYAVAPDTSGGARWKGFGKKPDPSKIPETSERFRAFYDEVAAFRTGMQLSAPAASQEVESTISVLDEQLRNEGKSGDGLLGKARALSSLVQEARSRVARIVGATSEIPLGAAIDAVEGSLNTISQKYVDDDAREAASPLSLEAMVARWDRLVQCFALCSAKIAALASPYEESEPQKRKGTWEERLTSKLEVIELCLQDYQSALKGIQKLGYSNAVLPSAVSSLGQILIDIQSRFRNPLLTAEMAGERLERFWSRLGEIHRGISASDADPAGVLERLDEELTKRRSAQEKAQEELQECRDSIQELGQVGHVLSDFRAPDESLAKSVDRLLSESKSASELLKDLADPGSGLLARAESASRVLTKAGKEVRRVLPDTNGALDVAVSRLTAKYEALRGRQITQLELIEELCHSVNFREGDLQDQVSLKSLLGSVQLEQTGPHRQLRLGLSSALLIWQDEVRRLQRAAREDVITALQLGGIQTSLLPILELLQNRPTESLLDECLAEGFAKGGFHYLFRAETLLQTYFQDLQPFDGIRECAGLAGAVVRAALRRLGCEVQMISLLQPAQSLPSQELEARLEAPPEFRRVREIWSRVNSLLDRKELEGTAVDVQLFLRRERDQVKGKCRVITLNPSEWRTFEGATR